MGPLDPFRTFNDESKFEAKIQRAIQARPACRVTRLSEALQEPVPADGITRLLQERHHDLGRTQGDIHSRRRLRGHRRWIPCLARYKML